MWDSGSNIKFHLKVRLIAIDLERTHGDDLRTIESTDELIAADPQFADAWFDLMILHPPRFIGHSTINPVTLHRNRGGDVSHWVNSSL